MFFVTIVTVAQSTFVVHVRATAWPRLFVNYDRYRILENKDKRPYTAIYYYQNKGKYYSDLS